MDHVKKKSTIGAISEWKMNWLVKIKTYFIYKIPSVFQTYLEALIMAAHHFVPDLSLEN